MTQQGISSSVQNQLIDNLRHGKPLDSSLGVKPTKVLRTELSTKTVIRSEFPDGSVTIDELEKPAPPGSFTTQAVDGCQVSSGSGYATYRNCRVSHYNVAVSAGFYANWQFVQGGYDSIVSTRDAAVSVRGGTFSPSNPSAKINQAKESASSPARATLEFQTTIGSPPYSNSYTSRMTLQVGRDTYTTTNNL